MQLPIELRKATELANRQRDRNGISFEQPVYTVEELRAYVIDGDFTPHLVLANGMTMSVQMFKGAYCTPRGWPDEEPRGRNNPMTSVEVGPMSPVPPELVPFAEDLEDTYTIFPYTPVDVIEAVFKKAGGVVEMQSYRPIRVAPWNIYVSERLIALRKTVDDLMGVTENTFVIDTLLNPNTHLTVSNHKKDHFLILTFKGIDAEYVEQSNVSLVYTSDLKDQIDLKIGSIGRAVLEHFFEQVGIANLYEYNRGYAFTPASFPDLTIELAVVKRESANG